MDLNLIKNKKNKNQTQETTIIIKKKKNRKTKQIKRYEVRFISISKTRNTAKIKNPFKCYIV